MQNVCLKIYIMDSYKDASYKIRLFIIYPITANSDWQYMMLRIKLDSSLSL